jgi:hypothetical protein
MKSTKTLVSGCVSGKKRNYAKGMENRKANLTTLSFDAF